MRSIPRGFSPYLLRYSQLRRRVSIARRRTTEQSDLIAVWPTTSAFTFPPNTLITRRSPKIRTCVQQQNRVLSCALWCAPRFEYRYHRKQRAFLILADVTRRFEERRQMVGLSSHVRGRSICPALGIKRAIRYPTNSVYTQLSDQGELIRDNFAPRFFSSSLVPAAGARRVAAPTNRVKPEVKMKATRSREHRVRDLHRFVIQMTAADRGSDSRTRALRAPRKLCPQYPLPIALESG